MFVEALMEMRRPFGGQRDERIRHRDDQEKEEQERGKTGRPRLFFAVVAAPGTWAFKLGGWTRWGILSKSRGQRGSRASGTDSSSNVL